MIGFITDIQTAQAVLDGIRNAQESRGLPYYWTTGSYPIYTRTHAGKVFLSTLTHRPFNFYPIL